MRMIWRGWWLATIVLFMPSSLLAQKKPPKAEGVKLVTRVVAERGFVDDAFAFDGAGGRLAVVRADVGNYAEVEVLDLDQGGKGVARFDLAPATTTPVHLHFVLDGSKLLVVGGSGDEKVTGYLVDLGGKILRKWGPATDIVLTEAGGEEVVTVFGTKATKAGTAYNVARYRLADGRAVGRKRTFTADADGFVKSLDMRILYWQDGYGRLVGRKRGAYDKIKDQRMNDSEAVYDLVVGSLARNTPIADIVEWTQIVKLRTDRSNRPTFLVVTEDQKSVELVTADDRRTAVQLSEPFDHYEPKSLAWEAGRDGRVYFSFTIDPVNPEALARKVADPELIDLYVLDPASAKARRLARLPRSDRPFVWRQAGGRWAVLRKHKGIDRGGLELEIYELTGR